MAILGSYQANPLLTPQSAPGDASGAFAAIGQEDVEVDNSPGFFGYLADAGKGLVNAPGNLLDSIVSLGEDVASWATGTEQEWLDIGDVFETDTWAGTFTEEAGSFALGLLSGSAILSGLSKAGKLGKLAKLAGWARGALSGQSGLAAKLGSNAAMGAAVDFTLADTESGNFSNLIQSFPMLENPITDFLAHKDSDSNLGKRLKSAMEGIPLGIAADTLFEGLKRMLKLKRTYIEQAPDRQSELIEAAVGTPQLGLSPADQAVRAVTEAADAPDFRQVLREKGADFIHGTAEIPEGMLQQKEVMLELLAKAPKGSAERTTLTKNIRESTTPRGAIQLLAFIEAHDNPVDTLPMREMVTEAAQTLSDLTGVDRNRFAKELSRSSRQMISQIQAVRTWTIQGAEALSQLSKEIGGNPTELQKRQFVEEFSRQLSLFESMAEIQANAGRGVKAFDTVVDGSGIHLKLGKTLSQTEADDLVKQLRETQPQNIDQVFDKVKRIFDDCEVDWLQGKPKRALARSRSSIVLSMLTEFRLSNLLSSSTTHAVNILGNLVNSGMRNLLDLPTAAILGRLGGDADRITRNELAANLSGHAEGIGHFVAALGRELRSMSAEDGLLKTFANLNEVAKRASRVDLRRKVSEGIGSAALTADSLAELGITNRPLGMLMDGYGKLARGLSFGVMDFGDKFAINAAATGVVERELRRLGNHLGLSGRKFHQFANPMKQYVFTYLHDQTLPKLKDTSVSKEIVRIANAAAQEARAVTFQQDLDPKSLSGVVSNWLCRTDSKTAQSARLLVMPFVKTPLNILDNLWAHTPVIGRWSTEGKRLLSSGSLRDRRLMQAKMVTGGALYTLGFCLYQSGVLTGAHDSVSRKQLLAAGIPEYSVRIGDKFYSYNRLDPVGSYLGIIADLGNAARVLDAGDAEKAACTVIAAFAQHVVNKSYLQGIGELLAAIQDPGRNGSKLISGTVVSFLPLSGAGNTAGTWVSPEVKEARTLMDKIMQRTILRPQMANRQDLFGHQAAVENLPLQQLLGIRTTALADSPSYREMAKYRMFPEDSPGTVMGVKLSDDEHRKFKETMKKLGAAQALDALVTSPEYAQLSDRRRMEVLKTNLNRYRRAASRLMLRQEPALTGRIQAYRKTLKRLRLSGGAAGAPNALSEIRDFNPALVNPEREL